MTYIPPQRLDQGAFGELLAVGLEPFFQLTFPYSSISVSEQYLTETLVNSGTVSQADGKLLVKTGTTASSSALAETRKFVKYNAGQGITFRAAGFFIDPVADGTMELGVGDDDNAFVFGYEGTSFGINRRYDGTDNWVAQADWNRDPCDGTGQMPNITSWDKGIPFQIRFQFLGYGMITWYVENPATGMFVAVHAEEYANTAIVPSVLNPSFPGRIYADNGSSTTDSGVRISSIAAFNEGVITWTGPIFGTAGSETVSTEEAVISIRNPSTVDGVDNRGLIRLIKSNFVTDGTKSVTFVLYRDATLSGSTSFNPVATGSFAEIDTSSSVTVSGGTPIDAEVVSKADSVPIPQDEDYYVIYPGETWTVTAQSSSSSDTAVSFTWQENP